MKVAFIIIGVVILALIVWAIIAGNGESNITGLSSSPSASVFLEQTPKVTTSQINVSIKNFAFDPNALEIASGTKVVWTNGDDIGHTITSDDGKFTSSSLLGNGQIYEFTFNETGEFSYHCTPHPFMTAKVIVK